MRKDPDLHAWWYRSAWNAVAMALACFLTTSGFLALAGPGAEMVLLGMEIGTFALIFILPLSLLAIVAFANRRQRTIDRRSGMAGGL